MEQSIKSGFQIFLEDIELDYLFESFESGYKFKLYEETPKKLIYGFTNSSSEKIRVIISSKNEKAKHRIKADIEGFGNPNRDAVDEYRLSLSKDIFDKGSLVSVEFNVKDSTNWNELTNSGDVFKVLRTVYDIVNDYIDKHKEKNKTKRFTGKIIFSGSLKDKDDNPEETQRSRVYKKMLKRLLPSNMIMKDMGNGILIMEK